ncbi:CGNR zinc finger domain-containing protein [Arthrobacter sp. MSA 4-2]|uniref:CGNR zinc finger domain-containing protein n=1 Tax=Arthrobacter sp. MSA 4-2 TaxID=2794349 RepID=UPI0018E89BB8|nr:CGNR zinc finger domain-containing protein [Arthrobacter sp. MSA 4-2]MBJ2121120.1 CGNR zinc finger domain-containing protein [Arthrobacter sp. MSA 4-2]
MVFQSAVPDEDLLLALLNSAPAVGGQITEELHARAAGEFAVRFGGTGSDAELQNLRLMRQVLHDVIRGAEGATERLIELLADISLMPEPSPAGIQWRLEADPPKRLAARAAMAWSHFAESTPGRLKACANSDCNLFFIDRSRPGTGKWCSMTTCGNRMKARAHASRQRTSPATDAR